MPAIIYSRRSAMGALAVVLWVLAHISLSSADLSTHLEFDTTVDASISLPELPTLPGLPTIPVLPTISGGLPTITGLPTISGALPSSPTVGLPTIPGALPSSPPVLQIPTSTNLPIGAPTQLPNIPGSRLSPLPQPTLNVPKSPGSLPTATIAPIPSSTVPAFTVPSQAGRTVTLTPAPAALTIPGLTNPVPSTPSSFPRNPPRGVPRRVFPAGAYAKTKN